MTVATGSSTLLKVTNKIQLLCILTFLKFFFRPFNNQCSHHVETSQLICRANQLIDFYMVGALVVKRLIKHFFVIRRFGVSLFLFQDEIGLSWYWHIHDNSFLSSGGRGGFFERLIVQVTWYQYNLCSKMFF